MIDFGFDKIALIGAVALIVIGPEKLPKVARTLGHLVGKAQRYVADVRAEVNRSIELDEIKKMKSQIESAAQEVETSVNQEVSQATTALNADWSAFDTPVASDSAVYEPPPPAYKHPRKKWRLKRGATPQWYKQRHGIRTRAQSGPARVARFRPAGVKSR